MDNFTIGRYISSCTEKYVFQMKTHDKIRNVHTALKTCLYMSIVYFL